MKSKPKPEKVYVCHATFASEHETVKRGTRLRGSDPRVIEHFTCFVEADIPENEWPSMWATMAEPPTFPNEFHRPAPPIPDEDAAVALVAIRVGLTGRIIEVGQRVRRDDPIVQASPEFFTTVPKPISEVL
jgi:hypothetical protein